MRTLGSIIIIALALGVAVAPADAQGDKRDAARKLFRAGEQAYNSGQYQVAAQAFEKSYELLQLPAIAFSTAQAHRLQYFIDKDPGRLKRAIDLYRLYLQKVDKGGRRDDAAASLAELEPILQRLEAEKQTTIQAVQMTQSMTQLMVNTQVAGAKASIDDQSGEVPLIREVKPGSHKIRVEAKGYFPVEQTATAVQGQLIPVEVELKPMPALVSIRTESGAEISVDGRPAGTAPVRALELAAGKHFITVTRRGRRPWSREVNVSRGDKVELSAPLSKTTQRRVSYWILGASALTFTAAGVTGVLAWRADGDASDLNEKRESEGLTPAELVAYDDARARRSSRIDTTYALLGIGATIGVVGFLTYLFDNPRAEAPPAVVGGRGESASKPSPISVVPLVSDGEAGLSLIGRF